MRTGMHVYNIKNKAKLTRPYKNYNQKLTMKEFPGILRDEDLSCEIYTHRTMLIKGLINIIKMYMRCT